MLHAGRTAWTTSDGVRLANRGMELFEVLWNYETDEVTFVRDLRHAGQFDLWELDFCSEVQTFLG